MKMRERLEKLATPLGLTVTYSSIVRHGTLRHEGSVVTRGNGKRLLEVLRKMAQKTDNAPANCIDCAFHRVLPDPDPHDWFCDDDVKVVCMKSNNRNITVACRPHHIRKESDRPDWCPLIQ